METHLLHAEWPLLSLLIGLPLLGGVAVFMVGDARARPIALGVSVVTFVFSLGLYTGFEMDTAAMQFVERVPWLPEFGVEYFLGIDGISLPLIILTAFINIIVVMSAWEVIKDRPALYMGAFQMMTGLMIGVFSALYDI